MSAQNTVAELNRAAALKEQREASGASQWSRHYYGPRHPDIRLDREVGARLQEISADHYRTARCHLDIEPWPVASGWPAHWPAAPVQAAKPVEARRELSTPTVWLIALFVSLLIGASWLIDGPTETDAAAAVALDLNDAIVSARIAAKEKP